MAKILYSDYYLPSNLVSTEDYLASLTDLEMPNNCTREEYYQQVIDQTKVKSIAIEKQYNLVEIFSKLIEKLLNNNNVEPDKISQVIYTRPGNLCYDMIEKKYRRYNNNNQCVNIGYYLIEKFKFRNANLIIINGKCTSTIQGISLANDHIKSSSEKYSLILTPNMESNNESRQSEHHIIGDGAGVMLIGNDNKNKKFSIVDNNYISDGLSSYYYYHKKEYPKVPFNVKNRPLKKILNDNNIALTDIRMCITVNSNAKLLEHLYGITSYENIYIKNIPYGGHIADVDLIRNFTDANNSIEFNGGDYLLLFALGTDLTGFDFANILLEMEE